MLRVANDSLEKLKDLDAKTVAPSSEELQLWAKTLPEYGPERITAVFNGFREMLGLVKESKEVKRSPKKKDGERKLGLPLSNARSRLLHAARRSAKDLYKKFATMMPMKQAQKLARETEPEKRDEAMRAVETLSTLLNRIRASRQRNVLYRDDYRADFRCLHSGACLTLVQCSADAVDRAIASIAKS